MMKTLTTNKIVVRIAIIIALAELIIMLGLLFIPLQLSVFTVAVIDVFVLVVITSPIIYMWVIKPFVVERDAALSQLTDIAYHDQLTQLPNRHFLTICIEKLISESLRQDFHGALILIDLDDFKPINDNYGHSAGDAVLVEVAKRLSSNIRLEDVAARLGGDEFIILLSCLNEDINLANEEAIRLSKKIQNKLHEPISYGDKNLSVGSSIGIRILGESNIGIEAAIREADVAMYKAKKQGKGSIVLFDDIKNLVV